jgi:ABC-type antimicrobial peptide transport system permease subunit
MKTKELYRLARRSLKEHKKTTKSTVRGLSVGFIILIPLIVVLLGVNISISNQLNEVPYGLYIEMDMLDYRIQTENYLSDNYSRLSGSNYIDTILENTYIDNAIVYENHSLYKNSYSIGIGEKKSMVLVESSFNSSNYNIIDIDKSDSYFPQNLTNNYTGGIFLEGCDQGFTNEGKQQVVVSENWLTNQGLAPENVYKNTITIEDNSDFYFSEEEATNVSGYICKDYLVVGIIKADVTNSYCWDDTFVRDAYMYADFFFTSVNVYDEGIGVLKPYIKILSDDSTVIAFDNLENKDILNEEYMMLGWDCCSNNDSGRTLYETEIYAESLTYQRLDEAVDSVTDIYINAVGHASSVNVPHIYDIFKDIFNEVSIISYLFSFVGIIITLCAIINLFSSIKHSVRQRKFYLTMLRAIGAHDDDIPKLYLIESAIIVSRANIFITIFGAIIASALKLLIDWQLQIRNVFYDLSIPWISIVICVLSVVVMLYALGLLFAYICTKKLSKIPIVSILNSY